MYNIIWVLTLVRKVDFWQLSMIIWKTRKLDYYINTKHIYKYISIFYYTHSDFHKDFDPFLDQKTAAFNTSLGAMNTLAQYVMAFFKNQTDTEEQLRLDFETLLEVIKIVCFFFKKLLYLFKVIDERHIDNYYF